MSDTEYTPVTFALPLQLKVQGNVVIGNLNGGAHNAEFAWTANGGLDAVHSDLRSAFQVIDRVALAQVCAKFWFEQMTQTLQAASKPAPSQESEVRIQRMDFLTWLEQNRFTLDLKRMRDSQHIWFRHTAQPDVLYQVHYENSYLANHLRGWYLSSLSRSIGPCKDTYPIQMYLSNVGQPAVGPQGAIPDLESSAPPPRTPSLEELGLRYLAFEKRVTEFMNTPRLNDMVFGPNPTPLPKGPNWQCTDGFGKDDT